MSSSQIDINVGTVTQQLNDLASAINKVGAASKSVNQAVASFSSIANSLADLSFKTVTEQMVNFGQSVRTNILGTVQNIEKEFGQLDKSMQATFAGLKSTMGSVGQLFEQMKIGSADGSAQKLSKVVTELNRIGSLDKNDSFKSLAKGIANLGQGLKDIKSVGGNLRSAQQTVKPLQSFVSAVSDMFTVGGEGWLSKLINGKQNLTDVSQKISAFGSGLKDTYTSINGLTNVITPFLSGDFSKLKNDFDKVKSDIAQFMRSVGDIGNPPKKVTFPFMSQGLFVTGQSSTDRLSTTMSDFNKVVSALRGLNNTFTTLKKILPDFKTKYDEAVEAITDFMKDVGGIGKKTGVQSGANEASSFKNKFNDFIKSINGLIYDPAGVNTDKTNSDSGKKKVTTILQDFRSVVSSLSGLNSTFTTLKKNLESMQQTYAKVRPQIEKFLKDIGDLGQTTDEPATDKKGNQFVRKKFSEEMQNFKNVVSTLSGLNGTFTTLSKNVGQMRQTYAKVKPQIEFFLKDIGSLGQTTDEPATDKKGNQFIRKKFSEEMQNFKNVVSVLSGLNGTFTTLKKNLESMKSTYSEVKSAIQQFINEVGSIGEPKGTQNTTNKNGVQRTVAIFSKTFQGFKNVLSVLASLNNIIKQLNSQSLNVKDSLTKIKESIQDLIKEISEIDTKKHNNFDNFKKVTETLTSFKSMISSLNKISGKTDLTKAIGQVRLMVHSLGGLADSNKSDFKNFINLANAMDQLSKSYAKLGSVAQRATPAVNESKRSMIKINPVVKQFFTAFAGYNVVYSTVRAVQKATKQMVQLQYAMARVNTITRVGSTTIRRWTYQVMSMSSTFGIAKQDITKALYEINSATILGSQAMEVLNASVRAARAGYTDTTKVAELLSKVINAYGYSARDASYLSDVLFKTVEVGINSMEQLSQYLGRVVTVAANAGVSFEEVSAAIATMTARGLQTNIAVTALNSAIMKLSQGSGKLNPVFRQMGYASSAAALATGGLSSAVQILHRATNGNTQALSKLGFNYRDIRAVTILASEAQSVFKQHLEDMKNSAGATDKALSQVADTLQYKWDQFKQTISNTVIEFQNFVNSSAILKGLLSFLSGVAQTFGQVAFALQQNLTLLQHFIKFIAVAYVLNKVGKLIGTTLIHAFRKTSVQVKALTAEVRAFGFVFSSTGVRASFTLKKLIVSFKALRASMIAAKLSMVALKAVMSFGAALVQFALIQAALWAISKLTDDATDATKKYREEVSRMKKDLDNVLPGIYEAVGALQGAQLGISNEKQLFQNAKDALSSLNQQIDQYTSKKEQLRNKKGTNLAQYNQVKYTLRSLLKQRKELQKMVDAQAELRHEYAISNKQLRRTQLNLKSIKQGLQKSRSERKDATAKEFKDLVVQMQYKSLKEYFAQLGVDLDNARYNVDLFQTQVKTALKNLGNDKTGIDTFNKNLLKSGDLLFKIQKGLQKVAEKLKPFKELQLISKDPFGFGRQLLRLQQLVRQHQKLASEVSKAQQVTITSNTSALSQAARSPIDAEAANKANLARAQLQTLMQKPISDFNTKINLKMKKLQQEGTFTPSGKRTLESQFFKELYDQAMKDLRSADLTPNERTELAFSTAKSQFKYYMKQNSYMSQDDLLKSLPQKLKNNQDLVNLIKQKDKYKVPDIPALLNSYREQVRKQEVSTQTQQKRDETLQYVRTLLRQGKITEAQGLHKQVFGTDLAYNKLLTNQDTFDQWRQKLNAGQSVQSIFDQQMQALRQYAKAQGLSTEETQNLTKQLDSVRKKFLQFEKNLDKVNLQFMDIKGYGPQLTNSQMQQRIAKRASLTGTSLIAGKSGYQWANMFNQWSFSNPQDAPQTFVNHLKNNYKLSKTQIGEVQAALLQLSPWQKMRNDRTLGVAKTRMGFGHVFGSSTQYADVSLRNQAYSSELHGLVQAQRQWNKVRAEQARLLTKGEKLTLQEHKAYSDARKTYIAAMDTFNRSIDDSYASMSFGRVFVHSQNYINARQAIDAQKAVYSGYLDDLAKVKRYQSLHPQNKLDDAARSVLGDKGAAKFLAANNTMRENAAGTQAINALVDDLKFGLGKPYSGAQGQYSNMRTSVKQQQQYLQRQRQKVLKLQKTHGQSWKQVYGLTNLAKLQQDVKNYKYNKERLDKYESALGGVPVSTGVKAQTAMSMGSSEFVNMFLSQTTKTPQQKSLQSIDSTSKKILKSVNKSANTNTSIVFI